MPSSNVLFQFSLRKLFVTAFCVALVCAILASMRREGMRHEKVACMLKSTGATVSFSGESFRPSGRPGEVIILSPESGVRLESDSNISFLRKIKTQAAFRRLNECKIVSREKLKDSIDSLQELTFVDTLSLSSTCITDSQLAEIFARIGIRKLELSRERLVMRNPKWLAATRLEELSMYRVPFPDGAIQFLPETLVHFDATHSLISDEGLEGFLRLKSLKTLILTRTRTSRTGVEQLRSKMQDCKIVWES